MEEENKGGTFFAAMAARLTAALTHAHLVSKVTMEVMDLTIDCAVQLANCELFFSISRGNRTPGSRCNSAVASQ